MGGRMTPLRRFQGNRLLHRKSEFYRVADCFSAQSHFVDANNRDVNANWISMAKTYGPNLRGQALGFGVDEIGGTESATVFQAISTTTLLEPVSPSAHQRSCAIAESATGIFPRMQNARTTMSPGRPLIVGEILNLREKLGDRFVLRIGPTPPGLFPQFPGTADRSTGFRQPR